MKNRGKGLPSKDPLGEWAKEDLGAGDVRRTSALRRSSLFVGMDGEDAASVLACLGARESTFAKGETILHAGESVRELGIVLEGGVLVVTEDFWGNRSIVMRVGEGETFAEAFASLGVPARFSVISDVPTRALFLDVGRVLTTCSAACRFHQQLVRNLVAVLAAKNLELSKKTGVLSQRTIRSKAMEYLSEQARRAGSSSFSIPFTRQQLADYLSVDRSSLSIELGKMAKEGILQFERNRFELL